MNEYLKHRDVLESIGLEAKTVQDITDEYESSLWCNGKFVMILDEDSEEIESLFISGYITAWLDERHCEVAHQENSGPLGDSLSFYVLKDGGTVTLAEGKWDDVMGFEDDQFPTRAAAQIAAAKALQEVVK